MGELMEFIKTIEDIESEKPVEPDEPRKDKEKSLDPDMVVPGQIQDMDAHAAKSGHQNYEQFLANGGIADDYQSPEQFMALKGPLKRIKEQSRHIKRLEKDFNDRLNGLNQLHKTQLDSQKSSLMAQRDAAMDDFDKDKARAYQSQLDNLQTNQPSQSQSPQISQDLQDWNNDPVNDWFKTDKAKSTYASVQFEEYRNQGHDDTTAIRLMESDVNRRFRDVNHNITGAPAMERGSKPGAKPPAQKITMTDLTHEETTIWNHSGGMWASQEAFLKSVSDSRGQDNA